MVVVEDVDAQRRKLKCTRRQHKANGLLPTATTTTTVVFVCGIITRRRPVGHHYAPKTAECMGATRLGAASPSP